MLNQKGCKSKVMLNSRVINIKAINETNLKLRRKVSGTNVDHLIETRKSRIYHIFQQKSDTKIENNKVNETREEKAESFKELSKGVLKKTSFRQPQ